MQQAAKDPLLFLVREEDAPAYDANPTRASFVMAPIAVMKDRDLSMTARVLYAILLDYDSMPNGCIPGQARLAEDLGSSVDTVQRAIGELEKKGVVSKQRRGRGHTNRYQLDAANLRHQGHDTAPVRLVSSDDAAPLRHKPDLVVKEIPSTPSEAKKTRSSRLHDVSAQERAFARWWEVWPRKEDKKDALKAWLRINPDEALAERMIEAVVEQRIEQREYRYRPLPATWLNKERWNNPAPPRNAMNGTKPGELSLDDLIRLGRGEPL
jgi:hypothetical protein